jgi:hypothetical protein
VASIDARPPDARWLVEPLWTSESVGLIAASPKQGKTWLAAEIALAVAAGGRALGQFPARQSGPVLFFGAEDDPPDLRTRFDAVAEAREIDLEHVPLLLLDIPTLSLHRPAHLIRLRATIAELSPRLLVLDPFVRIAQVDENSSTEVSALLGSLRELQREFSLSVILVHHMRKAPSRHLGQCLRGSSDFAAWHDSALFLTPARDHKLLTVEHRRARAPDPIRLRLVDEPSPHLEVLKDNADGAPPASPPGDSLQAEILALLRSSPVPLSTQDLRRSLMRRKAAVVEGLRALRQSSQIERSDAGWHASADGSDGQGDLFPRSAL